MLIWATHEFMQINIIVFYFLVHKCSIKIEIFYNHMTTATWPHNELSFGFGLFIIGGASGLDYFIHVGNS